ncbi:MAG: exo-alpha-sialidase [Planctomycetota bacterium]
MSDTLHVATRKGLFTYARNGSGWKPKHAAFLGDPVVNLVTDPRDGTMTAALKHGHYGPKMHRSRDGGKTWGEIATPEYPPVPDGVELYKHPYTGKPIPWKLVMVWELAVDYKHEGGLWAGTLPGGLFHSQDHGETWELNRPLWDRPERRKWFGGGYDEAGLHSVLTHPDRPDYLACGISCGGMWVSDDHGRSWTRKTDGMRANYMPPDQAFDGDVQDPHILTHCKQDPDTIWTQHHTGIFVTRDGGEKWEEITEAGPSTFGFACAVHPEDGQTAWFVPAKSDEIRVPIDGKFVVTRTRDGGKRFDVLTKGLPTGDAYDIVFRHALALDDDGQTLAMGTTTGNAWTSADQGDSWVELSGNLPPVYAVRFG